MRRLRCGVLAVLTALVLGGPAPPAESARSDQSAPVSGNPGPFVAPQTGATATATTIPVDGTAPGRTFDGVGAISGGGGNSRYLIDYPQPARDSILDYLFKPNYGAALQILKLEIGGDANSTDGSEASVEPTRGAIDCAAGYEFWLAEQAKARNPAIKLYGLAWTAPGWTGSFWSNDDVTYIVDWLKCAQQHGLTIDYLGGNQNEATLNGTAHYDKSWTEKLRAALDAAGFQDTKVVMSDIFNDWAVADDLATDAAFSAATDIVGIHDVCGYPTNGNQCTSTATALSLGKPLWGSELGAMDGNSGAASMARAMIRGYPNAGLTGFIQWPLVSAMPPFLPHQNQGLIYARQPWSGNYQVNAMTYAIAMMSWFTAPGWHYIDGANGGFGGTSSPYVNGSYTTLRSANGSAWTTIAETTTTTANQQADFTISGGLPATTVHVWRTKPDSTSAADWMVPLGDIQPANGTFSYVLEPGYIYTFTTLERGPKGSATPPPPAALGSYVEQPDVNSLDDMPVYLAPEDGAFRYAPCQTDPASSCIEQMSPQAPVYWQPHPGFPYAVIGDPALNDYTVGADILFTQPGSSAGVIGRFSSYTGHVGISSFRGYILALDEDGSWRLYKNSRSVGVNVLASGTVPSVGTGNWHHFALTIVGSTLTASIDGQAVGTASDADPNYVTGIAGIEAGATALNGAWTGTSWPIVQYRHLAIAPAMAGPPAPTGDSTPTVTVAATAPGARAADTTPPRARLSGATTQRAGKHIVVRVSRTSEALWASVSGTVSIRALHKTFKLGTVGPRFIAKGRGAMLEVPVPAKALRVIKRALPRKKVVAKLVVRLRDAAGNRVSRSRSIRLKR